MSLSWFVSDSTLARTTFRSLGLDRYHTSPHVIEEIALSRQTFKKEVGVGQRVNLLNVWIDLHSVHAPRVEHVPYHLLL